MNLKALEKCNLVRRLRIQSCWLYDWDKANLKGMESLKSVFLYRCNLNGQTSKAMPFFPDQLPNVELINYTGHPYDIYDHRRPNFDLSGLKDLKHLRKLSLSFTRHMNLDWLQPLKLETLFLDSPVDDLEGILTSESMKTLVNRTAPLS